MPQQSQHYAFVSASEPLKVPREEGDDGRAIHSVGSPPSTQDALVALYQSYAERFPNPRLIEEYQEREQLLHATSAAHSVARRSSEQQRRQQAKTSSWLGFLFGGGSEDTNRSARKAAYAPPSSEEEEWLTFTEVLNENEASDEALCGTNHSLDRSCIPQDAYSMARLSLASSRTRGERPHLVKSSPFLPSDCTMCIVGLGMIADWTIQEDGEPMASNLTTTSDRDDLLAFAEFREFDLAMARAVSFGRNCLLVSWGFRDGIVVFYRRIGIADSSIAWEALVFLGPSQAVLEHSFDLFADDDENPEDVAGSDLLRVTDMVPLVLSTPGIPAVALAVSRLGGYMEVLPLPLSLWNGPPFTKDRHRPRKINKIRGHYAKQKLVNIASEHVAIPILALTTMEYHVDILCLEAIRTRKRIDAEWDRVFYPKAPPSEYILVASGCSPVGGHEILTFWAISFIFVDEPPNHNNAGFTLTAILQEALDVDSMGANVTIFANREMLNQWRHPRKVALKETPPPAPAVREDGELLPQEMDAVQDKIVDENTPAPSVYDRVTTITTSAPIISMQAIVVPSGLEEDGDPAFDVLLSLLDWNGGVTIMDCSLFERMTSHHLSDEEYRLLFGRDVASEGEVHPPPPDFALVKTVIDRSLTMKFMKSGQRDSNVIPQCVSVQWLARGSYPSDPWLILLTSAKQSLGDKDSNQILLLSELRQTEQNNPKPSIQRIPFPTSKATLQGSAAALVPDKQGNYFSPALRILFSPNRGKGTLSVCLLQPLQPRDIILSLAQDGQYEKAIEASLQLGSEEQNHVTTTLEECHQKLWEQSWDLQWLRKASNDAYIIQQALSLFDPGFGKDDEGEHKGENGAVVGGDIKALLESMDVEMCRGICVLALQRTSKIRLASALALNQGVENAKKSLQGLVVRLGTYELLCRALNVDLSFARFRESFARAPMIELAKSFASVADLAALSILWFRHSKELKPCLFDILNLLPLALNPKSYCFLLPIGPRAQNQDTGLFVTEVPPCDGDSLLHLSQFPSFVKEKLGFSVVLNGNDEKMVLEVNSNATNNGGDQVEQLQKFYQSRATVMQRFVGNLRDIADFCAVGLLALGFPPETMKTLERTPLFRPQGGDSEATKEIVCTWGCARCLQRMLEESVGDSSIEGIDGSLLDLSPFATVTPLDLWAMELADIVGMVLGGQDDPVTIYEIYKQHLVPLVRFLMKDQTKNLDQAISTYCIALVRASTYDARNFGVHDDGNNLLEATKTCAAVAFGSRTCVKKSDRIIKDRGILLDLVLEAILAVSEKCRNVELPVESSSLLVKLMWDMYESLPIYTADKLPRDIDGPSGKADKLFEDLIGLDILSQWPECQKPAFSFVTDRLKLRRTNSEGVGLTSKQIAIFQNGLSSLCRSFCSQAKLHKGSLGLPDLLRDLISDIGQFHEVCFNCDDTLLPVLAAVLSVELTAPLSRQASFELVAQLLTAVNESWWDAEQEARAASTFVEGILFSEREDQPRGTGDHSLQAAILCQDLLGPVFPVLQDGFQLSRRYLDAAYFINTVIFTELKVPKTIKPNDLRGELPLDIIESILKAIPTAIVIGCKEWGEEQMAIHANKALRAFEDSSAASNESVDPKALPPIPGGAIFHLAGIFGLEDKSSVLVVKSRVVHHGMRGGFFGAAAAICRTLLVDPNAFMSNADSMVRLVAVADVVTRSEYEDVATKKELCLEALRRYNGSTSIHTCKQLDSILHTYTSLEVRADQASKSENIPQVLSLPPPSDSIGCLHIDSISQYSVNVYDLFWNLQQQSAACLMDDALLNALSRYVFFSCIFRSSRPRTAYAGKLEKATINELLVFGAAILLHINHAAGIAIPAIKELRQIVEQQTLAVINQFPTAFQDPFPLANGTIVRQLVEKGFPPLAARWSALATKNAGFPQALQWGIQNARNPRMNDPIVYLTSPNRVFAEKAAVQQILKTFTFTETFLSGQKSIQEWISERSMSLCGREIGVAETGSPLETQTEQTPTLNTNATPAPQGEQTETKVDPKPAEPGNPVSVASSIVSPTSPQGAPVQAKEISINGKQLVANSSSQSSKMPQVKAHENLPAVSASKPLPASQPPVPHHELVASEGKQPPASSPLPSGQPTASDWKEGTPEQALPPAQKLAVSLQIHQTIPPQQQKHSVSEPAPRMEASETKPLVPLEPQSPEVLHQAKDIAGEPQVLPSESTPPSSFQLRPKIPPPQQDQSVPAHKPMIEASETKPHVPLQHQPPSAPQQTKAIDSEPQLMPLEPTTHLSLQLHSKVPPMQQDQSALEPKPSLEVSTTNPLVPVQHQPPGAPKQTNDMAGKPHLLPSVPTPLSSLQIRSKVPSSKEGPPVPEPKSSVEAEETKPLVSVQHQPPVAPQQTKVTTDQLPAMPSEPTPLSSLQQQPPPPPPPVPLLHQEQAGSITQSISSEPRPPSSSQAKQTVQESPASTPKELSSKLLRPQQKQTVTTSQVKPPEAKQPSSLPSEPEVRPGGQTQTVDEQKQCITPVSLNISPRHVPDSTTLMPRSHEMPPSRKLQAMAGGDPTVPDTKNQLLQAELIEMKETRNQSTSDDTKTRTKATTVSTLTKPPRPGPSLEPASVKSNDSRSAPVAKLNFSTPPSCSTTHPIKINVATQSSASSSHLTPTNCPTSLSSGLGTPSSSSSDRSALKLRGETALQAARLTPTLQEQNREERKRLIEAGRRLLAKSRASAKPSSMGSSPSSSTDRHVNFGPVPGKNLSPIIPASTKQAGFFGSASSSKLLGGQATAVGIASPPKIKITSPRAMAHPTTNALPKKVTKLEIDSDDGWGFENASEKEEVTSRSYAPPKVPVPPPRAKLSLAVGKPEVSKLAVTITAPSPQSASPSWGEVKASSESLVSQDQPKLALKAPGPAPAAKVPFLPTPVTKAPAISLSFASVKTKLASEAIPPSISPARSLNKPVQSAPVTPVVAKAPMQPPAPAPVFAPATTPTPGQGSVSQLDASESQGEWDFDADGLGDLDDASEKPLVTDSVAIEAAPPPPPHLATQLAIKSLPTAPSAPAPQLPGSTLVGVADPEASESQGGWDFDPEDLGDIQDTSEHPVALPVTAPFSTVLQDLARNSTTLLATTTVSKGTELEGSSPQLDISENQDGWDFEADDDLGDIDDASQPRPPVAAPNPTVAPTVAVATAGQTSQAQSRESQNGWGFDGEDDLGDIEDGSGKNEGWGFNDESGHPSPSNNASAVVTKLAIEEDDGDGWGDDGWGFDD